MPIYKFDDNLGKMYRSLIRCDLDEFKHFVEDEHLTIKQLLTRSDNTFAYIINAIGKSDADKVAFLEYLVEHGADPEKEGAFDLARYTKGSVKTFFDDLQKKVEAEKAQNAPEKSEAEKKRELKAKAQKAGWKIMDVDLEGFKHYIEDEHVPYEFVRSSLRVDPIFVINNHHMADEEEKVAFVDYLLKLGEDPYKQDGSSPSIFERRKNLNPSIAALLEEYDRHHENRQQQEQEAKRTKQEAQVEEARFWENLYSGTDDTKADDTKKELDDSLNAMKAELEGQAQELERSAKLAEEEAEKEPEAANAELEAAAKQAAPASQEVDGSKPEEQAAPQTKPEEVAITWKDYKLFDESCENDDVMTVAKLYEKFGPAINQSKYGYNGIFQAARSGAADVLSYLLKRGADDSSLRENFSILHDKAKAVLDEFYSVNRPERGEVNPFEMKKRVDDFIQNCRYGLSDKVKKAVLFNEVDVDARSSDFDRNTGLLEAYFDGNVELCLWLMAHGANPKAKNAYGYSVENTLAYCEDKMMQEALGEYLDEHEFDEPEELELNADEMEKAYQKKYDDAFSAIFADDLNRIKRAVVAGELDLNVVSLKNNNYTLLWYACDMGRANIVKWLLDNGASPYIKDKYGKDLLDKKEGFSGDVQMVLEEYDDRTHARDNLEDVMDIDALVDSQMALLGGGDASQMGQTEEQDEEVGQDLLTDTETFNIIESVLANNGIEQDVSFAETLALEAYIALVKQKTTDGETLDKDDVSSIIDSLSRDYINLSILEHDYTKGRGYEAIQRHGVTYDDLEIYKNSMRNIIYRTRQLGLEGDDAVAFVRTVATKAKMDWANPLLQMYIYADIANQIGEDIKAREAAEDDNSDDKNDD